ncbi:MULTISPECIES: GIY-YIG nuclease family protein [Bacteria]
MLHDAMEKVLLEAGRPLKSNEIAEHINTRGLYDKRDGSPVQPDQVRARARKCSHLFAQATGTIGLTQWGGSPLAQLTLPKPSNKVAASRATVVRTLPRADPSKLDAALLDPTSFQAAGNIDLEVPDRPGFYAIRVGDKSALPELFKILSESRDHDLIYIGIASQSLSRRFVGQELRGRGHGTFFRSIGALLGYRPPTGSLIGKGNTRNYRFAPADNQAIVDWINANLLVNWVEFSGAHAVEELKLIRKHLPLLNLQGNPAALPQLKELRAECVRLANLAVV